MNELPSALLEGEAVALLYINSVCACVVTVFLQCQEGVCFDRVDWLAYWQAAWSDPSPVDVWALVTRWD